MTLYREKWETVKALFEAAQDIDCAHRVNFLEGATSDPGVRAEVERLLREYESAGDFLSKDSPLASVVSSFNLASSSSEFEDGVQIELLPGTILSDRFEIVELIGRGGMGEVWLARQSIPVRRLVALKVINAGRFDEFLVDRFRLERQSLAMMDHPAIAKIFDGGTTPKGWPYLVMEYVPGLPITDYCNQKRLTIRERLELFVEVCEGVQHAHLRAILHRDLKPSNVLVVEVDGKPMPRIIDFGIAKEISKQPTQEPILTQMGGGLGTLGYMSPEQADSDPIGVDTRTDVYSLGVILYQLLSGAMPFDLEQWRTMPFREVLRQLREDDPPYPSERVRSNLQQLGEVSKLRNTSPHRLVHLLRRELDWITSKAVEKDRNRRYSTPSELATDLRRYLRNEPVTAVHASVAYRLRKYVVRHRIGVTAGMAIVLLLIGLAVMQTQQLHRVLRERDRADRITEFMMKIFQVSNPSEARGSTVTAKEILDKASKNIETGLTNDPELEARLMYTMGKTYYSLGLYPQSRSLLESAVVIQRRVLPQNHQDTISSNEAIALTLGGQGEFTRAEELYRQSLDVRRRSEGSDHPDTIAAMIGLASILDREGRYAEAEELKRKTLDVRQRVLGPEHPDTLSAMSELSWSLHMLGKLTESEKLERKTLEVRQRVLGVDDPGTITSMFNLASTLQSESRYQEAETLFRRAVEIADRVYGPDEATSLNIRGSLADTLSSEGKYGEAETIIRHTVDVQRRLLGPEHPDTLYSMFSPGIYSE